MQKEHEYPRSKGDFALIEAVDAHISRYIGDVAFVMDEVDSPMVHVDVHVVAPSPERPYYTLVTSGMAEKPMTTSEEYREWQHAELLLSLPPEWPLAQPELNDERNWWPIRLLKSLARLPHYHETWLGYGHTIEEEGLAPYAAGTQMCAAVLTLPRSTLEPKAVSLEIDDGRKVWFWAVVPLYVEELRLKQEKGFEELERLLDVHDVDEVLNCSRMNVAV